MVHLAEMLLGKGYKLAIYDPNVSLSRIIGANKQYIEQVLPHLAELLVPELNDVLDNAETLLVGNRSPEFQDVPKQLRPEQQLIDLVRLEKASDLTASTYQGICW